MPVELGIDFTYIPLNFSHKGSQKNLEVLGRMNYSAQNVTRKTSFKDQMTNSYIMDLIKGGVKKKIKNTLTAFNIWSVNYYFTLNKAKSLSLYVGRESIKIGILKE